MRLASDLLNAMQELKAREGVPFSVQVDFALREWLSKRGFKMVVERKRAVTRRRS